MSKIPDGAMFRTLNADEEKEFRQWARDNWAEGKSADQLWHPVVRNEWDKIAAERENEVKKKAYKALSAAWKQAEEADVLDDLVSSCYASSYAAVDRETINSVDKAIERLGYYEPYAD